MFEKNERMVRHVIGGRKKSSRACDKLAVEWGRTEVAQGFRRSIDSLILMVFCKSATWRDGVYPSILGHALGRKDLAKQGHRPGSAA